MANSTSTSTSTTTTTKAKRRRKNICLFGTSANPPTGNQGHVGIVRALSNLKKKMMNGEDSTDNDTQFDEIRVVPVYSHPFSCKRKQLADFEHRKNMCALAFEGIERVTVEDAEKIIYQEKLKQAERSSIRVGTADLLDYYHTQEATNGEQDTIQQCDYSLCLGADTFLDLTGGKWRRTEEILNYIQGRFVVLYREIENDDTDTDETDDEPSQKEQLQQAIAKLEGIYGPDSIQLLQVPTLGSVSSTLVRSLSSDYLSQNSADYSSGEYTDEELYQRTEERLKQMVNDNVLEYMKEHQLYGIGEELVQAT